MIRIITYGQVQLKVGKAQFGDRLMTLAANGSLSPTATANDFSIGRVAGQVGKDGYATVFVNFK